MGKYSLVATCKITIGALSIGSRLNSELYIKHLYGLWTRGDAFTNAFCFEYRTQ